MLISRIKEIFSLEYGLKYKIKDVFYEIKLAHQRFWKGYDNRMVWGMNRNLLDLIHDMLDELHDNHMGYPVIFGEIETDEDYKRILKSMMDNIKMAQHYEDYFEDDWTKEDFLMNEKNRKYHQDKFFELFSKYFDTLWD